MEVKDESYIIEQFKAFINKKQNEKKRQFRNKQKKKQSEAAAPNSQSQSKETSSASFLGVERPGLSKLNSSIASSPTLKTVKFRGLSEDKRLSSEPSLEFKKKEGVSEKVSRLLLKTKRRLKIQKTLEDSKFEKQIQIFKNLDTFIDIREFLQDLNITNYENLDVLLERLQLEKASMEKGAAPSKSERLSSLESSIDEEENSDNEENEVARIMRAKHALMRARHLTKGGNALPPRKSEAISLSNTIFEYLASSELRGGLASTQEENQEISKFDAGLLHKIRKNFFSYKDKEEAIVLRAQRTGRYQTQMANLETFFEKHLRNAKITGGEESLEDRIAKGLYIQTFKEHANKVKNLLVLTTKNIFKSKESDIDKKFRAQNKIHQESLKKIELLRKETSKMQRRSLLLYKAKEESNINEGTSGEVTRLEHTNSIDESQIQMNPISGNSTIIGRNSKRPAGKNQRYSNNSFSNMSGINILNSSTGKDSNGTRADDTSEIFITENKVLDDSVLTSALPAINPAKIVYEHKRASTQPKKSELFLPFLRQNKGEPQVFITSRRSNKSQRENLKHKCLSLMENIDDFKRKFKLSEEMKDFDHRIKITYQDLQPVFQNYKEEKIESLRMLSARDINQNYLFKVGESKNLNKSLKGIF